MACVPMFLPDPFSSFHTDFDFLTRLDGDSSPSPQRIRQLWFGFEDPADFTQSPDVRAPTETVAGAVYLALGNKAVLWRSV